MFYYVSNWTASLEQILSARVLFVPPQMCLLKANRCFFFGGGKEIDRSKSANRAVMFHLSDTKQSWNMNLSCGA